jgi:hypothetical protein
VAPAPEQMTRPIDVTFRRTAQGWELVGIDRGL